MKINHIARNTLLASTLVFGTVNMTGCSTYNTMQAQDESINGAWSEVVNQYQRRADLIPNLVKVVGQYATHEQDTLTQVTQARSQATTIKVDQAVLNDPEAFKRYQQAQDQLGSSLARLMAVSENYPNLKADVQFQNLQAELAGTENRIAVARKRYIDTVQQYNTTVRSFPNNLIAKATGMQTRPNFSVANEAQISTAPTVDFGSKPNAGGQPVSNSTAPNAGGQPTNNTATAKAN